MCIRDSIHAAAKLVDFVILDCSTSMTNVFTPCLLYTSFSTVVFIFIAVLLLAFIIDLFSIISTKQELDHAADQMVKQIQLSGGVNGETDELFEFLSSQIEGAENIS